MGAVERGQIRNEGQITRGPDIFMEAPQNYLPGATGQGKGHSALEAQRGGGGIATATWAVSTDYRPSFGWGSEGTLSAIVFCKCNPGPPSLLTLACQNQVEQGTAGVWAPEGSIFTTHFHLQPAPSAPCWVAPSRARTAFRKESEVRGSKAGKWSGKSRQRGTSTRGQS
ncbi:unnamed protein product [Lota lota]